MFLLVAVVHLFSLLCNSLLCVFAIIYFSLILSFNITAISRVGHMSPSA